MHALKNFLLSLQIDISRGSYCGWTELAKASKCRFPARIRRVLLQATESWAGLENEAPHTVRTYVYASDKMRMSTKILPFNSQVWGSLTLASIIHGLHCNHGCKLHVQLWQSSKPAPNHGFQRAKCFILFGRLTDKQIPSDYILASVSRWTEVIDLFANSSLITHSRV